MTTSFATNAASNSAVSYLQRNSAWQSSSIAKLSSGSRIVKASDDAASLAVGTKLKADVTALKQASINAAQASSLLQVADGALSRISDTLIRMKSLATQARSDVLSNAERDYLNQEYAQMISQIDFITSSTKFNDVAVVSGALGTEFTPAGIFAGATAEVRATGGQTASDVYHFGYTAATGILQLTNNNTKESQSVKITGSATYTGTVEFSSLGIALDFDTAVLNADIAIGAANSFTVASAGAATFQLGVTAGAGNDDVVVNIADSDAAALGVTGTTIDNLANAEAASGALDTAITTMNTRRANIGASMSRLEKIGENLATTIENLDSARSVLLDVDVAEEMTKFTTNQVMTQAATAMLAQANQLPQNLMQLLQ